MRLIEFAPALIVLAVSAQTPAHAERRERRACVLHVPAGAILAARTYRGNRPLYDSFIFFVPLSNAGHVAAQVSENWSMWPVFKSSISPPAFHIGVSVNPSRKYLLRLSAAGGERDYTVRPRLHSNTVSIPLPDFDNWIGQGDWARVTVVEIGKDGAETVAYSQDIDIPEYRRRLVTSERVRAALAAKAADSEGSCANAAFPEAGVTMTYDCARKWTNDRGSFEVDFDRLVWTKRVDDALTFRIRWFGSHQGQGDLDPHAWRPYRNLEVAFEGLSPDPDEFSLRRGSVELNASILRGVLEWPRWQKLVAATGVLEVSAYRDDMPIYRRSLPPDLFAEVEKEFLSGSAMVVEDYRIPEGRCKLNREEERLDEIVLIN